MGTVIVIKLNIFSHGNLEFFFRFIKIAPKIFFLDGSKKRLSDSVIVW